MARLNEESSSVQAHMATLQAVITRMSQNSASCKAWAIALTSAILVLGGNPNQNTGAWLALVPILLFAVLDAYYLGLEKAFRDAYKTFVAALHEARIAPSDLYDVSPLNRAKNFVQAWSSPSVWIFYPGLALAVILVGLVMG